MLSINKKNIHILYIYEKLAPFITFAPSLFSTGNRKQWDGRINSGIVGERELSIPEKLPRVDLRQ